MSMQMPKALFATLNLRRRSADIQCTQPPHESELHHIAVDEQELCPPTSLTARDRLHARVAGRVV